MDYEEFQRMSPENSPVGVRKVNNIPILLVGLVLFLFIFVFGYSVYNRSENQKKEEAIKKVQKSVYAADEAALGVMKGVSDEGYTPPESSKPPEMPKVKMAKLPQAEIGKPPLPSKKGGSGVAVKGYKQRSEAEERIAAMKLQRLQKAIESQINIPQKKEILRGGQQGDSGLSHTAGPQTPMLQGNAAMLNRLAAMKQQLAEAKRRQGALPERVAALKKRQSELQSGMGSQPRAINVKTPEKKGSRWELNSEMDIPNPYELRTGAVIPGILISGINSELPGQITGQVAHDVYDTATGQSLLIPHGTRLIGRYSSKVKYGQSRVLVAWQRLIFPDGKALDLGLMPGADSAGYSGFNDMVDNHYIKIFGGAFLMSGITAAVELSNDSGSKSDDDDDNQRISDVLRQSLARQIGEVSAKLIEKNMNISPTVKIRPGYRFNIIVTKDISFTKPYQAFDY